jgi:hypothetical protein
VAVLPLDLGRLENLKFLKPLDILFKVYIIIYASDARCIVIATGYFPLNALIAKIIDS